MKRQPNLTLTGPPSGVVEVWSVSLDSPALPLELLAAPVSEAEREHAKRMTVGGAEWAAAHGALRTILGGYLGTAPRTLKFRRTPNGKPRLADVRGLEFSFSLTDGLAVIAVASDREVGVDVERENDRTHVEDVARAFLSPVEVAAVESAPAETQRTAFFAAWARHEARLKLLGRGLGDTAAEALDPGTLVVTRRLVMRPGYAAAVAAEGGSWALRVREFELPG